MRFWNRTATEPWAITQPALSTILRIAERQNETPEAVAAKLGRELNNTYATTIRDGVAMMPINGPLFRHANLFTMISGATSYERIAHDFNEALANDEVKAIVLNIDSPGGEVNGCSELANLIYESRGSKPIIAYASGDCASGAYWVASACDQIIVSDTAQLGSIGVVAVYRNAGADDDTIEIVSSQSPYKRLDLSADDDRARIQTRIDALAEVFIQAVATHRGLSDVTIKSDFGQGDVFIGQTAVERGLADSGGTLEKIHSQLNSTSENPATAPGFLLPAISQKQSLTKGNPMDLEALQAEHPTLCQQLIQQGVTRERTRIGAILNDDEAKGRHELAMHLAFSTALPLDTVQAALKSVPVMPPENTPAAPSAATPEQASGFTAVMNGLGNPTVVPEGETPDEDDGVATALRIAGYSNPSLNPSVKGGAS